MWIALRVAEFCVDLGQEQVRDGMLQHFGLVVHFIPAIAEFVDQIRLQQPVPTDHEHRRLAAVVGQRHRAVLFVVYEPLVGELAYRFRCGARRHAHALGQHFGADLFV
ncbi:Uncharacterised protein [Mycobacteroides abscessus subsp. abscessus]|nr:Uncharacterised protein [Mycobacteroides abscessus subsp. abscessus]